MGPARLYGHRFHCETECKSNLFIHREQLDTALYSRCPAHRRHCAHPSVLESICGIQMPEDSTLTSDLLQTKSLQEHSPVTLVLFRIVFATQSPGLALL